MSHRPLPACLLAELSQVALADAWASVNPADHDDLSDRPRAPRDITSEDWREYERLVELGGTLLRRARRAGFAGPPGAVFGPWKE